LLAGLGIGLILLMQKLGVRSALAYVAPALVLWAGAYATGVHPTIAGVIVGLLTPVRVWFGPDELVDHAAAAADAARSNGTAGGKGSLHAELSRLDRARKEAVSPVERLQHALHGWVAFGIMPLFALANAGVALGSVRLDGDGRGAFLGVLLGLVLGKPIGVVGFAWLAVRIRVAALPAGVRWPGVLVVGLVAGIGFTMALFIASLAFPAGALVEVSKLGILAASVVAGVIAMIAGRLLLPSISPPGAARSLSEAEGSTAA
jgi:NhaA family Na+:H+ antiporter